MRFLTYRSIYITYADGTIENYFGVAGHITTASLLFGETEVTFYGNNASGGYRPKIVRYLTAQDRLVIRTHEVIV
jgi:hypothetical protein